MLALVLALAGGGAPRAAQAHPLTGALRMAGAWLQVAGQRAEAARQRACLALALYHEARGEPLEGQIAVAATIMNRVASKAYPPTICGVVFQNAARRNACQFSFACDTLSLLPRNRAALQRMEALAARIIAALDETGRVRPGAAEPIASIFRRLAFVTHYHRHDVHPAWSRRLARIARIGAHVFLRSERVIRRMPAHLRLARVLMHAEARG